MERGLFLGVAVALTVFRAAPAVGLSDTEKCEDAKLKASAKYGQCRLLAEAKAVRTGDPADYSKCDATYTLKWSKAETNFAGACPTSGDQVDMQGFVTAHTDDVTMSVTTGSMLPNCPGDLTTCSGSLDTCNSSLGSCNTNLSTCNSNLTSCNSSLTTVNADTAAQNDGLSGLTFSSSAGVGVTGTMTNVGQQNVTPGTSPVTITQGYHDGTGTVAGDADLVAGNIKSGVSLFGVTGTLLNPPLKTGQTTTYGTGSDGDLQQGASRSFTDNGDGTISDNLTGLMWEKKSDDGSIHDKDNTYTWGLNTSPYTMNGTMVTTFLAALNGGGGFAGYTDWRIPNVNELQSLVNYQIAAPGPTVYPAFDTTCAASCTVTSCSCAQSGYYWSSTTYQTYPDGALGVDFFWADASASNKSLNYYVRAVRGGS